MTADKQSQKKSPIHVHVEDSSPVHVHVKKPKKPIGSRPSYEAKAAKEMQTLSNMRRGDGASQSRVKSPMGRSKNPWIPPPARSTSVFGPASGHKISWQGPSHRLELCSDELAGDGDTDEEEKNTSKMRMYEKKIDTLMNEVGVLRNEVELQRSTQELSRRDEELEDTERTLAEKQSELDTYRHELDATEAQNRILKRSMDYLKEDSMVTRNDRERLNTEREVLMKKLVEVELDGQAAAKQMAALRDIIRRLREEQQIVSVADASVFSKQKELLVERLGDFEETNRSLRQLLRERHDDEADGARLAQHRDLLLRKLTDTEDRMVALRTENIENERKLGEALFQLDGQKQENMAVSGLQASLESTRGHLQKQLRQKEADCNRMAVQIRSLESQLAQERIDLDHLQQLLGAAKQKAEHDKEALKKATRVQKHRASRSEDAAEQLQVQLVEREQRLADTSTDTEGMRTRLDKMAKEKAQSQAENTALKMRLAELESILERLEDDSKVTMESANMRIQEKTSEATTFRMDNDRLKMSLVSAEDKLLATEDDNAGLRTKLRQSEVLVEEYRGQMNKSRREADRSVMQLDEAKRETDRVVHDGESEMDKVKSRLQSRLAELEPIPALLQSTEMRLADTSERLHLSERRHADSTRLIADLTAKSEYVNMNTNNNDGNMFYHTIDSQTQQLGGFRENVTRTSDSNRSLEAKVESLEKKLRDIEEQNRDLLQTVSKREETIHQTTVHLDERSHETASLQRQLKAALTESRRQTDNTRDKTACKERTWQQRVLDLESQLSAARTENARLKREKDDAERKCNTRLYDMRDRLDQSHATNRSLQNYVQFLKSSYAKVFGDTTAAAASASASAMYGGVGASPLRGGASYDGGV